ncbi:Calmodulin binding protein-like [Quillaja saponaria]|nr:Calmodulin binding protein-like [Quillaja saponaria]
MIRGRLLDGLEAVLEPVIRRVVREVVEAHLQPSPGQALNQTGTSGTSGLELRFINNVPRSIFTLSKLKAEDDSAIEVALFDARSHSIVKDGPLSSIKIEICVLNGDFGSHDKEDWSKKEFNASVVRERDGKRPLLTGDVYITLQEGVGCISNTFFTDNSKWIRSGKFRLGARVVQQIPSEGYIREARSESFTVKDHRGELYKKHFPPSLNDEIWRLTKISKDGKFHKRLSSCGIHRVKDLLQLYAINPSLLQEKFGGISKKCWEAIVEHATACVVDNQNLYIYYTTEPPIGLLFNSIYKVVAVTFDCKNYCSLDTLSSSQKNLVEKVKQQAYKNVNDLISVDEQPTFSLLRPLASLQSDQLAFPQQGLQQFVFPSSQQEQEETWSFNHPLASTSHAQGALPCNQEVSVADNGGPMPVASTQMPQNNYPNGDFLSGFYNDTNYLSPSGLQMPVMPGAGDYLPQNDKFTVQTPNCFPAAAATCEGGNDFYMPSVDGTEFDMLSAFPSYSIHHISRTGNPKAGWCKIRAAIKWSISVRRDVAAKKWAKLLYYNY